MEVVPLAQADVAIHWADVTVRADPPRGIHPRAINASVRDIGKHHVSAVHGTVFGYDLEPEADAIEFVEKSDANATHDGRIVARRSAMPGW